MRRVGVLRPDERAEMFQRSANGELLNPVSPGE